MDKCAVCKGTGKCQSCQGHFVTKGCVICSMPYKGKCPRCKGTGQDPVR